ncbi:MAG: hypothetical protein NTY19_18255 [Planctomycetota bacterium]|nr:hypothetical protein [Planctomycetota bacterium]
MLRAYVRQGGVLIADVRPAIYDGHVKPLAAGQLDDVFGVKRTGFAPAVTSDGVIQVPSASGKPEPLNLAKLRVDATPAERRYRRRPRVSDVRSTRTSAC